MCAKVFLTLPKVSGHTPSYHTVQYALLRECVVCSLVVMVKVVTLYVSIVTIITGGILIIIVTYISQFSGDYHC